MAKVAVVYWSGTGNTAMMAQMASGCAHGKKPVLRMVLF